MNPAGCLFFQSFPVAGAEVYLSVIIRTAALALKGEMSVGCRLGPSVSTHCRRAQNSVLYQLTAVSGRSLGTASLRWAPCLASPEADSKVVAELRSWVEALGTHPLPGSLRFGPALIPCSCGAEGPVFFTGGPPGLTVAPRSCLLSLLRSSGLPAGSVGGASVGGGFHVFESPLFLLYHFSRTLALPFCS